MSDVPDPDLDAGTSDEKVASEATKRIAIIAGAVVALALIITLAIVLTSGDDDGDTETVADDTEQPDDAVKAGSEPDADDAPVGGDGSDVGAAADVQTALDDARATWLDRRGDAYVLGYSISGEGDEVSYCHEGIVGTKTGGSDAAACPFTHEAGSVGVDEWFEIIQDEIDGSADGGRVVEASFDPETGHPTSIFANTPETDDGFLFTLVNFDIFDPDADAPADPADFDACDAGDADACYRYGATDGPPPPSFDEGNSYPQTPNDEIVRLCGQDDHQACYHAGSRGLPRE